MPREINHNCHNRMTGHNLITAHLTCAIPARLRRHHLQHDDAEDDHRPCKVDEQPDHPGQSTDPKEARQHKEQKKRRRRVDSNGVDRSE